MNSYETITFEDVRDRAKARIRKLNSTIEDMYVDMSILDANRNLKTTRNIIQKESNPIDVCNYIAELPCDYSNFIAMATIPCTNTELPFVYTNYPFDAPNHVKFTHEYRIEKGQIRFPSNFDATQITLFYDAFDSDSDGFPILYLQHVDYYIFACLRDWAESEGDFKKAQYWETKMWRFKNAIIFNENVDKFRESPPNALRNINVSLWYTSWYNNRFLQQFVA